MITGSAYILTRSAILSGVSAERWVALLKLHISNQTHHGDTSDKALEDVCSALMSVMVSFPSSNAPKDYLEHAIQDGVLSLSAYVSIFPAVILNSPEFQTQTSLWSALLDIVSQASRSVLSLGSPTPSLLFTTGSGKPPSRNAETIENVIKLLRLSYTFQAGLLNPTSSFIPSSQTAIASEQLIQSLTSLVILLLTAVSSPGVPRLPPSASTPLIASVTDLVDGFPLGDVKGALDAWLMSFTLASGAMDLTGGWDDVVLKPDGEAEVANSGEQGDSKDAVAKFVPPEEDLVPTGFLLRNLIEQRGKRGSGSSTTSHAVSLLLGTYRSTIVPHPTRGAEGNATNKEGGTHTNPPGAAFAPSISPSISMAGHSRTTTGQTAESHNTPGVTPGMTPTPAGGGGYSRTPAHNTTNSMLGRTPQQHHQQNTTTATSLQAHTPLAVAQTPSGRTPSNNNLPRTPGGPFGKQHARTPTASGLRDSAGGSSRRPGQAKAQIFFEKLFMSAVAIVAEAVSSLAAGDAVAAAESQIVLRQAFVFGRLPELIATFQDFASASSSSAKANQPKFRSAVEQALATIFTSHASLLDACDPPKKGKGTILGDGQMMDITTGDDLMKDGSDEQKGSPFRRNLLTALARRNLISLDAAKALYPPLATSHETGAADTSMDAMEVAGHPFSSEGIVLEPGRIEVLAQESVANKQDYCDWVLLNGSPDEVWNILEAMLDDFSGQAAVAVSVQKVFGQSTGTHEGLERLCALCKVLAETSNVLDVLSLHLCISELVADGLAIVDDFDVSSTGDTQLAYTQLGSIILFLQLCSYQYGLPEVVVSRNGRKLSAEYLTASWAVYHPRSFSEDERNLMKIWHNNVFAGQTEGLDERLLRSTHPKILLHMGASLFSEALANKSMDVNALISGAVAYFLEPVFNWSLVGIVRGLADDALRKGYSASSNLKVIHAIVTAGSCPQAVLTICGRSIIRLLDSKTLQSVPDLASFDGVKTAIHAAVGVVVLGDNAISSAVSGIASTLLQLSTKSYAARIPPSISAFQFYPPQIRLEAVHSALLSCVKSSDTTRTSRQLAIALFWLAQTKPSPPLIPYFLNSYLPDNILPNVERVQHAEQSNLANVTALVVGYALMISFRSERAVIDVKRVESRSTFVMDITLDDEYERKEREQLKEAAASCPSVLLATRLAKRLKAYSAGGKTAGALVHKRLLAVPQFASNFPGFASA